MLVYPLFILCLLFNHSLQGAIDLDGLQNDFVLETKKIDIAGYPTAFNPSMIEWNGSILMCFRIRDPITAATNRIGYLWLDEEFNPTTSPKELNLGLGGEYPYAYVQDPRLIMAGGQLYMVFNDKAKTAANLIRRMFISKLSVEGEHLFTTETDSFLSFPNENFQKDEKNWAPFECNGSLMLTYGFHPFLIFKPLFGAGHCETVSLSDQSIDWEWGELRGGTQALLCGNEYLGFFHSSKEMKTVQSNDKKISHYFIGAYTFNNSPPFSLTSISSKPIVGENFYRSPEYKTWKPLRVVFPGGFIYDQNYIWIAYGKQDHEVWIAKLCRKGLLNSLVQVK